MRRLYVFLMVTGWVSMGRPAAAYETAGHFYSVVAELAGQDPQYGPFSLAQLQAVAFCAQLPDLSREFDAITVRAQIPIVANVTWGLFSSCWSSEVRHMVAVQHYVHALTGGAHGATLQAARDTVTQLRARMAQQPSNIANACALGLATHLLGDAFAHERMDGSSMQYATGLGHFRDNTRPDHPLVNAERLQLWQTYLSEARTDLNTSVNAAKLAAIDEVGQKLFDGAQKKANFDEAGLISGLEQTLGAQAQNWVPFKPSLEDVDAGQYLLSASCASVAQRYASDLGTPIDCSAAWRAYVEVVVKTFAALPPACELEAGDISL